MHYSESTRPEEWLKANYPLLESIPGYLCCSAPDVCLFSLNIVEIHRLTGHFVRYTPQSIFSNSQFCDEISDFIIEVTVGGEAILHCTI